MLNSAPEPLSLFILAPLYRHAHLRAAPHAANVDGMSWVGQTAVVYGTDKRKLIFATTSRCQVAIQHASAGGAGHMHLLRVCSHALL